RPLASAPTTRASATSTASRCTTPAVPTTRSPPSLPSSPATPTIATRWPRSSPSTASAATLAPPANTPRASPPSTRRSVPVIAKQERDDELEGVERQPRVRPEVEPAVLQVDAEIDRTPPRIEEAGLERMREARPRLERDLRAVGDEEAEWQARGARPQH